MFTILVDDARNTSLVRCLVAEQYWVRWRKTVHHGFNTLPPPEASIIATKRALGNGEIDGIHDIVRNQIDVFS